MSLRNKTRQEMCDALGVKYTTFTDWVTGNSYPRIDKIELMANYFGIEKSDLIEDKAPATPSPLPPIIDFYNQLNDAGKAEATKRVEELTFLPKYTESIEKTESFHLNYGKNVG